MSPVLLTALASLVVAVLETLFRYLRDRNVTTWQHRPVIVSTVVWIGALALFQVYRTQLTPLLIAVDCVVGGVVWYAVSILLGRALWRSARG